MPGRDTNIGAKRAKETRAALGHADDPPADLLAAVEDVLRIPVALAALPDAVAGCCWRDGPRTLLWVNGRQPVARRRFTLAHELGHVRCGHQADIAVDTFETLSGKTTDAREIQANAFAAELLAPAVRVREMVDGEPSLEDVVRVAARFGLSSIAALYRLNTLGLSNDYEELKEAIDAGEATAVWEELDPEGVDDTLARLRPDSLPRLSPSLRESALAAALLGSASTGAAAAVAGADPEVFAHAVALVARPGR